ncbi:hypothetical protein [Desulfosarcina sp. BuS5]|uniref:hypothetical protein n=1 Tax=Desulfosarcina sp. BuS5 TaxID=933262 RepID=UPI00237952B4|nr:hypothetical protein [Desulfosarcina sp. BuS5]
MTYDKLTVSSAALRTRSTYRRLSSSSNVLDRFRSRSTYQGRSSRLRFSTLNEKKPPFSFSACDSRGSTAGDRLQAKIIPGKHCSFCGNDSVPLIKTKML